jgi:hypothetical protein
MLYLGKPNKKGGVRMRAFHSSKVPTTKPLEDAWGQTYFNKYVIQIEKLDRWEHYRLIAKPEDLKQLIAELSIAINKLDNSDKSPQSRDAQPIPLWEAYATRAFERADRVQFQVFASDDLSPFHQASAKKTIRDFSQAGLIIFIGLSVVIGCVTMVYYALKWIGWLSLALRRL